MKSLIAIFLAMIPPTVAVGGGLWLVYQAMVITENDNIIWAIVLVAILAACVYPHGLKIGDSDS